MFAHFGQKWSSFTWHKELRKIEETSQSNQTQVKFLQDKVLMVSNTVRGTLTKIQGTGEMCKG